MQVRRRHQRWALVVAAALWSALSAAFAHADDLANVVVDFSLTSWGVREGLPPGPVWAVAQDAEGYLWLGTDAGAIRFDGVRFLPWGELSSASLPNASVRALSVSRDGSLWLGFGGDGGVTRVQDGRVRHYGSEDGLDQGAVSMISEHPDGTLWVGNSKGLYRFTNDRWQALHDGLPVGPVYSALVDAHGRFLVGSDAGLFSRDPGVGTFRLVEGLGNRVRGVSLDRSGAIWVTDPFAGFRKPTNRSTWEPSPEKGRGFILLHDSAGTLWVGTSGQGLWRARVDVSNRPLIIDKATTFTGFSSEWVTSMLEDREGNLWAATFDGLNRLTPHKLTPVTNLGLVTGVESTPDGSIWVGTADSIIRFSEGQVKDRRETVQLSAPLVAIYADERGVVWAATNSQLLRFRDGEMSVLRTPSKRGSIQISSITSDFRGGVWTYDRERGLERLHEGQWEHLPLPPELQGIEVASSYTDRTGQVWFAFVNGLAAVVDLDGVLGVYGPRNGLSTDVYHTIYEDHAGVIWLGGNAGLSRFVGGHFETLSVAKGFPVELITGIVEDNAQYFWLGSQGLGVIRIHRRELDLAFEKPAYQIRYKRFDKFDGFAGNPWWSGNRTAARTKDGRLWFVSGRGVTIIDPHTVSDDPIAPIVVRIESAIVDRQRLQLTPQAKLPPRVSAVEIEYTAINLTSPLKTRFRYRLDGFDQDWVDAGARRQAFYTNLSPQKYRFHVAASNDEGRTWTEADVGWDFSVLPMFYQTGWFAVGGVTTFVLTVAAAWRFRVRQVRKQFTLLLGERVRLSREVHDTLLQGLVGVALQFDAMAKDVGAPEMLNKERFIRMRKHVEVYIREARQTIWDLRSPKLLTSDLPTALRRVGEHATVGSPAEFDLTVKGTPQRCSTAVEEQLLRIGQEAVVNAVRHGRASHVRVELVFEESFVRLGVSDNGNGFDPSDVRSDTDKHYGLITMRERAHAVGGDLKVSSEDGQGTLIETVVPISRHRNR